MLSETELLWLNTLKSSAILADVVTVEQFSHALTNEVFLITDSEKKQFVFKRLNRDARSEEDRKAEFNVQKLANKFAITPRVLAHDKNYKLQQFVAGELLQINNNKLFSVLATQLKRVHKLPALHAPKQRLAIELQRLKNQLAVTIDEETFLLMFKLAQQLDSTSPNDTLCHGDLSLNNVIKGQDQHYYILDWEYAVIACAAYDLAFCNCINNFSESESRALISHYYSLLPKPQLETLHSLQKKCDLYLKVFIYINELWSLCFVEKRELFR